MRPVFAGFTSIRAETLLGGKRILLQLALHEEKEVSINNRRI
jgi:hypothetical protein